MAVWQMTIISIMLLVAVGRDINAKTECQRLVLKVQKLVGGMLHFWEFIHGIRTVQVFAAQNSVDVFYNAELAALKLISNLYQPLP